MRPFTIQNVFKLEAGNGAFDTFMEELRARFGNTPFMNMYKEIKAGTYDLNDVSDLQDAITDEMLEIISPFKYLVEASRYNPLVYLENKVADYVVGDNVEAIQQFAAELDLPEFLFEHICEDYR